MDAVSSKLLTAQVKAEALFAEVVHLGLVSAGKLESELTADIHALAQSRLVCADIGSSASRAPDPIPC